MRRTLPTDETFVPLELYLNTVAVALTACYHASLLLGILAPTHSVDVVGTAVPLRLFFLPASFLMLVILVDTYGFRLAVRLAVVGMAVFFAAVLLLVAGLILPSAQPLPGTTATTVNLARVLIAVFAGLAGSTALALVVIGWHRVTGSRVRFAARLFAAPLLGSAVTDAIILSIYYGPASIPAAIWQQTGAREPLHVLYCVVLVPVGYGTGRLAQSIERRHEKRVRALMIDAGQRQRARLEQDRPDS